MDDVDGTLWIRTRMEGEPMKSACQLPRNVETTGMCHCLKCNRVWEKRTRDGSKVDYYRTDAIPTYGKPKTTCPECEQNENL